MTTPSNALNITSAGLVKFDGSNLFSNTTTTQYNVLVGGVNNSIDNIPPSSNPGELLTSNGLSSPPSFQSAPAGSYILLDSQTASSSTSIQFTTGITSKYTSYLLNAVGITKTTGALLYIQLSTNGGSSYISTNYQGAVNTINWDSATITNYNTTSGMAIMRATNTIEISCQCWLFLPQSNYPSSNGQAQSGNTMQLTMGAYNSQITPNAFQIVTPSGNFSGVFNLYGIKYL